MKTRKSVWLFLDGKPEFNVVDYALARNIMLTDAKEQLRKEYAGRNIEFRILGDY